MLPVPRQLTLHKKLLGRLSRIMGEGDVSGQAQGGLLSQVCIQLLCASPWDNGRQLFLRAKE